MADRNMFEALCYSSVAAEESRLIDLVSEKQYDQIAEPFRSYILSHLKDWGPYHTEELRVMIAQSHFEKQYPGQKIRKYVVSGNKWVCTEPDAMDYKGWIIAGAIGLVILLLIAAL